MGDDVDSGQHRLILAAGSMLDCDATTLIDAAADAGFDGVGLRLPEQVSADLDRVSADAAERGVAIHDVEVHRIGSGSDPTDLIGWAAQLGAAAVLVVSDLVDRRRSVAALREIVEIARAANVGVGLEYMAWTTPSTPFDALEIANEADCDLVVDVLHHQRVGASRRELAAIVADRRLGWLQLCDAPLVAPSDDLVGEARHFRSVPGAGSLPLADLVECVPSSTPISVEVQSDELLLVEPRTRARLLFEAARSVIEPIHPTAPDTDRSTGASSTGPSQRGHQDRVARDGRT